MAKGLQSNEKKDNTPKPKNQTPEQQFPPEIKITENESQSETKVEPPLEEPNVSSQETSTSGDKTIESMKADPVSSTTVTVIDKKEIDEKEKSSDDSEEKGKKESGNSEVEVIEARIYNQREQDYIDRLDGIRKLIDNPAPINRLNKRRKYSEDRRRNTTLSLREDLSYLLDDFVDDAKIYKGLFSDMIIELGVKAYIEKYGLK